MHTAGNITSECYLCRSGDVTRPVFFPLRRNNNLLAGQHFSLNQAAVNPYQIMYTCGMLISAQKPYTSLPALIEDCDEVMCLKKAPDVAQQP